MDNQSGDSSILSDESAKSLKDVTNTLNETKQTMDSSQKECKQINEPMDETNKDEENEALTLDLLPSDIFLHICSFLDAKFVIQTLSKVCSLFHQLIHDNTFWKIRLRKRWPKKYPAIPGM